jgi:pyridinium-3,5-biscarboxylic acid mononucleotide sulfurtransferase
MQNKMTEEKSLKLNKILNDLDSIAVAFSGGVDSSFLLHRAHALKKSKVIAITIKTPYIPARELEEAIEFTSRYGINHKILEIPFPEIIQSNPPDRCYLCKKSLFTELLSFAEKNKFSNVIDGTNWDDTGEHRPGMKALKEMGIISPLLEAGLTKKEIRELSKSEGLEAWDKPAMACLLTRIPYDTVVEETALRMIEKAEEVLFDKGYPGTRVRMHGDIARIECMPGFIEKIMKNAEREDIIARLKKIGFRYVTLDLEGYRTGGSETQKKESYL